MAEASGDQNRHAHCDVAILESRQKQSPCESSAQMEVRWSANEAAGLMPAFQPDHAQSTVGGSK